MNDEALPAGITRTRYGWRVRVWVKGQEYSSRLKRWRDPGLENTLEDAVRARRHLLSDAERDRLPAHPVGTFAADVHETYLPAVKSMPTYLERERDMGLWEQEFGPLPRSRITPAAIRAVRERWLTVGPRQEQYFERNPLTGRREQRFRAVAKPLSASTVNHRLRALENFFTVVGGGRHAPNPVREVPEESEPDAPPRALPVAIVRAILQAMPASKAAARLHALAWAGIPPATLARMNATMVYWDEAAYWRPGRKKGKGTKGQRVPLTPDGLAAFRMVAREDAWKGGERGHGNGRRTFRAACWRVEKAYAKAGTVIDLSRARPYDLRHSIATETAAVSDLAGTELLIGVTSKTAQRYAKGAIDARLLAVVTKLAAAQLDQPEVQENEAKPTTKPASPPASRRKQRRTRA